MKSQHAQIASVALDMIAQVNVRADEQSLMTTLAVRQMLNQIAKGEIVLMNPAPRATPDMKTAPNPAGVPDLRVVPNTDPTPA